MKPKRSNKLCECGCGKYTFLSRRNRKDKGIVIGQPSRFLEHHAWKAGNKAAKKHGHRLDNSMTYCTWTMMRQRCLNSNHHAYKNYGGRGITICERWNDFRNFLDDMGERTDVDMTLERIDVDGNYEPSNCQWVPRSEQAKNRRNTIRLTHNGEMRSLTDWARTLGISHHTVRDRLERGWSVHDALTIQPRR